MRNVGGLGEAILQQWCSTIGASCNKAVEDRGGWDYLVELDHVPASGDRPLDLHPSPRTCLVQVKSTDGRRGSHSVKLSNWRRLVFSSLPTFFLVFEFDGGPVPADAYLIHVWEPEMASVLKRLRELSCEEPLPDLRKRRRVLKWGVGDRLSTPNSVEFLAALENAIGTDAAAYTNQKLELLRSLGYEDGGGIIDTLIKAPDDWRGDPDELFADLRLGLIPSIETHGGKVWDERFGLRGRHPAKTYETVGRIEMADTEPHGHGPLELRTKQRSLRLDADYYVAGLKPEVKSFRDMKVRVSLSPLDLIFRPDSESASFQWEWPAVDEAVPITTLAPMARLVSFLLSADEPVGLFLLGDRIGEIEVNTQSIAPKDRTMFGLLEKAWTVAKASGHEDHLQVSLPEVWNQQRQIDLAHHVLRRAPLDARIFVGIDSPSDIPGERCGFPQVLTVTYSEEVLVIPTLFVCTASLGHSEEGLQCVLATEDIRIGEIKVIAADEDWDIGAYMSECCALAWDLPLIRWWEDEGREGEGSD